ncbi:unnamed protein product [Pseudo-nitzschia multistriata]|uniref:Uncharacterized protein n=1 Tax=Pseudo-nitzschia multistriata TaxID=183589 RepID=A0A448ZTF3_9STRA|nr:unnamed protein product [Pseudo-nitzschia multistriata]
MKKLLRSQLYTHVMRSLFPSLQKFCRKFENKVESFMTSPTPVRTCSYRGLPSFECTMSRKLTNGIVRVKFSSKIAAHRAAFASFRPRSLRNSSRTRKRTSRCSSSRWDA